MSNREKLVEAGFEECVVFESPDYDNAIIGVTDDGRAVYDMDLMVEHLVETEGMSEIEAIDFIDYNTIRSLPYVENPPVLIRRLDSLV
jgi:hypothetical protein